MGFTNRPTNFDLSELHIERLFITDFMPVASGTFVKVYLMGFMFASSHQNHLSANHKMLATMLQLPLTDILEAWTYWEKQGIVKKHFHENSDDFDIEFLSLRELYIENNYEAKQKKRQNSTSSTQRNSTFAASQASFSALIKRIEKIVGHPLSPQELRDLSDYQEHYYRNEEILAYAFEYNYLMRKRYGFKRVKSLLDQWLSAGLVDLESITAFTEQLEARQMLYKDILASLGVRHRLPYQAECDAIDKWIDEYHFEPEKLLNWIKHLSTRTTNVNFNYLESQLNEVVQKGDKDVTEIKTQSQSQSSSQAQKQPPKRKQHQFTVEKDRTYTEDELEDMLLNKK